MDFASKTNLTRYSRDELLAVKQSRSSQKPPPYQSFQNIIRFDIRKHDNEEPKEKGDQFKVLREILPELTTREWDPKLTKLLEDYHRSLLYPPESVLYKGEKLRELYLKS